MSGIEFALGPLALLVVAVVVIAVILYLVPIPLWLAAWE